MLPERREGARSNPENDTGSGKTKGAVPELEEFIQEGPLIEEPEITALPVQNEFYRVPRRFGSIPVDELPLGCDQKKQYYGSVCKREQEERDRMDAAETLGSDIDLLAAQPTRGGNCPCSALDVRNFSR